ncbi:MAG: ribosomal protein [Brevundimonas sp.]|nr:ribosomal protein [Brevundimonas sp.]
MSKAVIATGGKQYIVTEGETLNVELLDFDQKQVTFEPLLVIDCNDFKVVAQAV